MVPPEQLRWYAECLPLAGACVIDVGASVGEVSAFFHAQVGAEGSVVSVEPLRSNVRVLEQRVAAVGARNWRIEACAISEETSERALVTSREDGHHPGIWGSVVAPHGTIRVPTKRLHEIDPHATIVKLDIEGHEYVVLDDALGRMPSVVAWAIELHMVPGRSLQGVLAQLENHGYRPQIAGRPPSDPGGPWRAFAVPRTLDWSAIPAMSRPGGGDVVEGLKTIHVLAMRAGIPSRADERRG